METVESFTPAKIITALAQENVTETVITKLKEYKKLVINDLNDKDGFNKVVDARKECKNTRILAEKICKKGRESAIAEQKAWVLKQNEVVKQISDVEDYLSQKEKWFELETEKVAIRKKRLEQLPNKKEQLRLSEVNIPSDEVILGMDDVAFITYLHNERERILNEKEAALKAKEEALKPKESIGTQGDLTWKEGRAVFTPSPQGKFIAGIDPISDDSPVQIRKYTDNELFTIIAETLYKFEFPIVKGEEAKKLMAECKTDLSAIVNKIMSNLETINT